MLDPELIASMPVDPAGLATAVAGAVAPVEAEAEQGDLFAGSPLAVDAERAEKLFPAARRGRPLGAQNKATEAWRQFMLARVRSPLLFLADLYQVDPIELHRMIVAADRQMNVDRNVSLLDVLNLQKAAAAELGPFLHRKQPIAIDGGEDKPLPVINQVVVGPGGLAALFPQSRAGSEAYVPREIPLDGEVAGEKSHEPGEGDASA